jgi:hypothetical protein
LLFAVIVLTLAARMTIPVIAQNPTGAIRGTVTDPQGAVVHNGAVTVTNKETGEVRKANTGEDGIYSVVNLLPGQYEVKVEVQGFATSVQTLTVQVGNTTPGDFQLRVGKADEIVDIVADAPIVDKSSHKIDGVITRQKIDALPLNGRNFLQLAQLEPGVRVSVSQPGAQNNLFNVSIAGAPSALTRLTVDGGSILDPVCGGAAQNFSTETIQEFQISTFNFDLSTGVTSVGAVNIVSRTGTNEYHGNAFLFFRDHSLAAVPTIIRPSNADDLFFRRYQYGGSFGGPIKKDKARFFGNIERLDQNSLISTFVTDSLGRLSQFSSTTRSPYDGILYNIRGDITINSKNNLFARYSHDDNDIFAPDAENTSPSNWRENSSDDDNIQVGLTTVFTNNLVNDLRFNYQKIINDEFIPSAASCPSSNPGCIGRGGPQIRVLGSNLRIGNTINAPQNRNLDRYQTTENVKWIKGAHSFAFGGEWEHNYGKGGWAFLDPALVVVHDPAVVLGVNAAIAANPLLPAPVKAALNIPVPAAFTTPGAPVTVNDILNLPIAVAFVGLGDPSQPPPFNGELARQSDRYRLYWQDSWKARNDLTLFFGASYQYETNLLNHDLAKPNLIRPLVGALDKPGKDTNNIAPSAGFSWDIGGTGKTVIRGGAGIYYDTVLFVTRLRERAAIGPAGNGRSQLTGAFFQNTIAFPQIPGLPLPISLINPALGTRIDFQTIPTKFTAANFLSLLGAQAPVLQAQLAAVGNAGFSGIDFFKTGTDLLDPGLQVPYSEQFNIGVTRQLPMNMGLSATFVLRKRVHTLFQNDFNLSNRVAVVGQPVTNPVIRRCVGAEAINPTVQCSNGPISVIQSSGREQYKGLLVKLDKRFSNRYQFTASYALSSLTGFFTGEDLTNWFGNHGQLGGDARHLFTFSGVLDLPADFQLSLIAIYSSRGPFNARVPSNIDLNGDGTSGDTLPGLDINSLARGTSKDELFRLVNEFNANFAGRPDAKGTTIPALALPTRFEFGDNFQSHDIRLTKTFKVSEGVAIQGFVEVFNVFNIANLGGFSTTLDTATSSARNFGRATTRAGQNFGTGGPRAVQLGGRFTF